MWKSLVVLAIAANTALISLAEAQCCEGKHEIYSRCSNLICRPLNCSQVGFPRPCVVPPDVDPVDCTGGIHACVCERGYARNSKGKCIPIKKCPSCGGDPNAVSGCGVNCGRHCSEPVICPKICKENGCDCRKGYLFDDNTGKCVRPRDCSPVCRKNEVYDKCANGGCNRRKCSELAGPIICKDPAECIADCVCIEGYLRNEDGVCVPESKCEPKCPGRHEVYNSCPPTCPPQTCESLQETCDCHNEQERPCEPDCVCEDGYYRNKIGECITKDECLQCSGPHEYFSCGGACDNVCLTLNEQSKDDCPIINIICNKMCYCEDGYARNESNICIPIQDCPPPRCSNDERWEEYPCQVCDPLTCSEVGKTKECPPVQNDCCDNTPTCVCKPGLVRNDNGDCIPSSECFGLSCLGIVGSVRVASAVDDPPPTVSPTPNQHGPSPWNR